MLSMDYNYFFQKMREELPYMKYIDCAPLRTLDDYYKTDPHWRQERIEDVAIFSRDVCGTGGKTSSFGEKMYYLMNHVIQKCRVYDKENPVVKSEKELIIFRDSFASAIAPLLAEGYSKITFLDIR